MDNAELLELLNMENAAKELGIAKNSLRRLVLKGELRPIMIGCQPRFPRWTLMAWQAMATGVPAPNYLSGRAA